MPPLLVVGSLSQHTELLLESLHHSMHRRGGPRAAARLASQLLSDSQLPLVSLCRTTPPSAPHALEYRLLEQSHIKHYTVCDTVGDRTPLVCHPNETSQLTTGPGPRHTEAKIYLRLGGAVHERTPRSYARTLDSIAHLSRGVNDLARRPITNTENSWLTL